MGMGFIVALIMKQKDWAAEFKHITDIMSELAMSKGYISRLGMVRHRSINVQIYEKGVNYDLNVSGTSEIEEQDIRDLK